MSVPLPIYFHENICRDRSDERRVCPPRQMAGSWSVRHGEQIRSTPSGRTDNNYFQVVDTPGFGNSLEEEEVSHML